MLMMEDVESETACDAAIVQISTCLTIGQRSAKILVTEDSLMRLVARWLAGLERR